MRTASRSRRSTLTLAALGCLAALVAVSGPSERAPRAAAAPGDGGADAVHGLDFASLAQPGSVCADALDSPPPLIAVQEGHSAVLDQATVARLSVDEVRYADLDGDGGDEAVVRVRCDYGANGAQDTVQVWRASGRTAEVVDTVSSAPASVAGLSGFPPAVAGVDVDGAAVEITWQVWAGTDPHCCPSEQAVVTYELDDTLRVVGDPEIGPAAG